MGYRKFNNPYACTECESRREACICCDTGFDTMFIQLLIDQCDGTKMLQQDPAVRRYRGPELLPCGPAERYPENAPCGVFWSERFGVGSTGCDGDDEQEWDGRVGLLIFCDPTDPANPYVMEVYCYSESEACWKYQGDAGFDKYECRCFGPYFEVTLPDLECCCESVVIDCSCVPPDTLYANFTSACPGLNATAVPLVKVSEGVWSAGVPDTPPELSFFKLVCLEGVWKIGWTADFADCGAGEEPIGVSSCDPFVANGGGSIGSPCCPEGASFTVSIME